MEQLVEPCMRLAGRVSDLQSEILAQQPLSRALVTIVVNT
jgi:hypothetical protein